MRSERTEKVCVPSRPVARSVQLSGLLHLPVSSLKQAQPGEAGEWLVKQGLRNETERGWFLCYYHLPSPTPLLSTASYSQELLFLLASEKQG